MKLAVGITKLSPGWITVLQQIGIVYEEITAIADIQISNYSVIIISSPSLSKKERNILYEFVYEGGSVISEASISKFIFKIKTKYSYIKYLYTKSDEIFRDHLICDLYLWNNIPENANHLENQDGQKAVLNTKVGKGSLIVFPDGFIVSLYKKAAIRKNFYSSCCCNYVSEKVSKVSKEAIYIFIQNALEYLFHEKNLPFVHLWFFPHGEKNIFGFRVDTDYGTKAEIESLNNLFQDRSIPATWFVEVRSAKDKIRLFTEFENQEISYHCYRHKTFLSYDKNNEDLMRGLKILKDAGINPVGYAAPYGKWNKTIARLVNNHNFLYSSEFDFAYDSLPLYPYLDSNFSKVLQIPIHPISTNRLMWGGYSEEKMIEYYSEVIDKKLFFNLPIFLYTHPAEKRYKVLKSVFEKIKELNIYSYKFSEYVEWWKKRIILKWSAELRSGKVKIFSEDPDESLTCRVVYPTKEIFILPFNSDEEKRISIINKIQINHDIDPNDLRKTTIKMVKQDVIGKLRKLKQ